MYGAPVLSAYMASALHFDRRTLGLAFAIFQWMTGLPGPLVAFCLHRIGVRRTLMLGCFLVIAGAASLAAFVHTRLQVDIVFGVVVGLGVMTGGPLAAQTGVGRWFVEDKARAIALLLTSSGVGGFLAPAVLDRTITFFHGNWRAGWWLVGGLSIVSALLAAWCVDETPPEVEKPYSPSAFAPSVPDATLKRPRSAYQTSEQWAMAEVLRSPVLYLMLLSGVGFSAGFSMFLAHGVVHMKDLGHSSAQAALAISLMLACSLLSKLLVVAGGNRVDPDSSWLGDRWLLGWGC